MLYMQNAHGNKRTFELMPERYARLKYRYSVIFRRLFDFVDYTKLFF